MSKAEIKIAETIFRESGTTIDALLSRWEDESEYESIDDYAVRCKPLVEAHGATFIKMMKRPFGFSFSTGKMKWKIGMTVTGKYSLVEK